jgi:hypothetical protein
MPADLTETETSITENGKTEALARGLLSGWKISRAWQLHNTALAIT